MARKSRAAAVWGSKPGPRMYHDGAGFNLVGRLVSKRFEDEKTGKPAMFRGTITEYNAEEDW